ncbi:hypothetical protein HGA91_00775 [candidate division WWE3 bacterium]|nr:hypothetical protein [candidate division WWE3 bacterium]
MNIRKMLRFVGGSLTIALVACVLLSQAPAAEAVNRPTNADIFTGRIIPAFIGEAYDPTQAFAELAGLPVYVFTFDFWAGFNEQGVFTSESWINSNLAVRTQIRTDGSFQVQGLPAGSYYGVYFPFILNGGTVSRVECTSASFAPAANDTTDTPTNPCRTSSGIQRDWSFRMPENDDKILDVFSYKANYLPDSQVKVVDSQVEVTGASRNFEQIAVRHAFVTTRNELDISNNINTFPVVPNDTLRISISAKEPSGSQYEIWAQRVTRTLATTGPASGQLAGVLDFPIIKGRAIRNVESVDPANGSTTSTFSFQAFAPEGFYEIIVWRRESSSPSYSDWDGQSALNSHSHGVGQVWVVENDMSFEQSSDWRRMLNIDVPPVTSYQIIYPDNRLIVWGTITNEFGSLLSSRQLTVSGPSLVRMPNARLLVESDLGIDYSGSNNDDQNVRYVYLPSTGTGNQGIAVRGIYQFGSNMVAGSGTVARSDDVTVILDNSVADLSRFDRAASGTGLFRSTDGPRRIDVVAHESATGNEGFDEGLLINVPGPGGTQYAPGARVTVAEVGSEGIDVPAENNLYYTNRIGQVHIPPADLRPITRPGAPAAASGNLGLNVLVRYNQYAGLESVDYAQGSFHRVNVGGLQTASKGPDTYNLALLNWIKDAATPQSALAATPGLRSPVGVTVKIPGQSQVDGRVNVNVYQVTNDVAVQCDIVNDCILFQSNGTDLLSDEPTVDGQLGVVPASGSFIVSLPAPVDGSQVGQICTDASGAPIYCDALTDIGIATNTYEIVVEGDIDGQPVNQSRRISIDSSGTVSPPQVTIDLEFNCEAFARKVANDQSGKMVTIAVPGGGSSNDINLNLDIGAQINGLAAGAACAVGDQFAKHVPGVMSAIFKYGLQTRALTQDQAIISIYDIIRNVVNVLFVLIFVVIGVMTILRYQPEQWHISVILPQLLMGVVLANFSLIIVQALLDINNFLSMALFQFTQEILQQSFTAAGNKAVVGVAGVGAGVAVMGSFASAAVTAVMGLMSLVAATGGGALIGIILFAVIFIGIIFMQVMLLLLLFFARYAIIWLAVIVAPAIFAFSVMPWFDGLRSKWFSAIVGITFVQTAVAAVLCVGILLLTIGADEKSMFAGFGSSLIAMITLWFGVKLPQKMINVDGLAIPTSAAGLANAAAKFSKDTAARRNASLAYRTRKSAEQDAQDKLVPPSRLEKMRRGVSNFGSRAFSVATLGAGGAMTEQFQMAAEDAKTARDKALEAGKRGSKAGSKEGMRMLQRKAQDKTTVIGRRKAQAERFRLWLNKHPEIKNVNFADLPKAETVHDQMPQTLPIFDMQNQKISKQDLAIDKRTGQKRTGLEHLDGQAGDATLKDLITDNTSGKKVSLPEFLRRLDTLDPEQRAGILREARKYKALDDD